MFRLRASSVWVFLALLLLGSVVVLRAEGSPDAPVIGIEPHDISVAPGESFTLNFTISDVTLENSGGYGIYGWEIDLSFNSSVVEAVSVGEGPFLKTVGSTWWTPKIDNATGLLVATDLLFPYPDLGAFGSGVLANATFKVMAEGKTTLHFLSEAPHVTKLRTYDGVSILVVESTVVDAVFEYPLFRDVAVTDVVVGASEVVAGESVSINVTVVNGGKATESFDVAVSYDSTAVETKHVTDLAPDGSQLLSYSWDTKDVAEGNYTISASASAVSGEANATNNVFHDGVVWVKAAPPAFPWMYVAVGVGAAVVIVVAGSFLYMRRRKP